MFQMLILCTETLDTVLGILVCTVEGADTGFYVVEKCMFRDKLKLLFHCHQRKNRYILERPKYPNTEPARSTQ
jgi:hypothetical protein